MPKFTVAKNIVDTLPYKNLITDYLLASCYPYKTDTSDFFMQYFLNKFEGIECIFMYGSMLNPLLSSQTSYPDFYVIVDNYGKFYKSNAHTLLNRVLPPNSYFLKLNNNGTSMPSKYCVIDKHDLHRLTHYPHIKDFFIAGRLAKRIAILYTKDREFLSQFIDNIYNAMHFNVMFALSDLADTGFTPLEADMSENDLPDQKSAPKRAKPLTGFTFDDFMITLLGLSYRAEIRTETDDKITSLYSSEKDFYEKIYTLFLEQEISNGTVERINGRYRTIKPYFNHDHVSGFISTCRWRAVCRWPKSIYTFSNFVDYLELKIERTTGEKLYLTKWDRKFPLIFGWRHLFRLLKKKALR
jgi:hypothetical protein